MPFQKGGADLPSIPGHPAFEVGAGENEEIFVNLDSSQDFVPDRFLPIIFADRIKGVDDPTVGDRVARVERI